MSIQMGYVILAFSLGMLSGLLVSKKFTEFLEKIYYRYKDKKRRG